MSTHISQINKPPLRVLASVAMQISQAMAEMCLECNAGQTLLMQKIISLFLHCLCLSRYCFSLLLPSVCCAAVLLVIQCRRDDCGASADSAIFELNFGQLHMPLIRRRDSPLKHIVCPAGGAGVLAMYMQSLCQPSASMGACKDQLPYNATLRDHNAMCRAFKKSRISSICCCLASSSQWKVKWCHCSFYAHGSKRLTCLALKAVHQSISCHACRT